MTKEEKKEYDRKRYLKKRETIAEQQRRYYQENKEAIAEHKKQYYQENKDKIKRYIQENKKSISEQRKQYRQENKETIAEYGKQYYQVNKDKITDRRKKYYYENREEMLEYQKQYYSTLKGYCNGLRNNNIRADRVSGRIGKELPDNYPTIEYYMDAVQQPCIYCKKHKPFNEMGLDRIDNDKPHSLDNVVPCCTECNVKRGAKGYEEFMLVISKDV